MTKWRREAALDLHNLLLAMLLFIKMILRKTRQSAMIATSMIPTT